MGPPGWVPGLGMLWGHMGHRAPILFSPEAHAGLPPGSRRRWNEVATFSEGQSQALNIFTMSQFPNSRGFHTLP